MALLSSAVALLRSAVALLCSAVALLRSAQTWQRLLLAAFVWLARVAQEAEEGPPCSPQPVLKPDIILPQTMKK